MYLGDLLIKLNTIITYLKTKRKRRLYAQWIEKAQLPPEAVPQGILDYPSLGGKLGRGRRHPY